MLRRPPSSHALPFPLLVAALAAVFACATNPATGKRELTLMSEAQEVQLGAQSDQEIRQEMGLYEDAALQRYVQDVGARLAARSERPNLQWHFAVVDVAAVNAFALPGGYIYVTRGILPYLETEAELAGVIGHEIGHVTARHSVQQYTRATFAQLGLAGAGLFSPQVRALGNVASTGFGLLFLKYGRDDERQADVLGVRYASRGGWDPQGVPNLLATLGRLDAGNDKRGVPNWLLTHPQPAERVAEVQPAVQQASAAGGGDWIVDREGYLRRVDGIIFGDNPREGIVRGRDFLHPDLRFAMAFPDGWTVNNGKTQVVAARPPGDDAFVVLQLLKGGAERSLLEVARSSMENAGFVAVEGGPTTINGLEAFVASYDPTAEGGGANGRVRAAHIRLRGQVYLIAGIAPAAAAAQLFPAFDATIRSFRELPQGEAAAIRPNRLALYTAKAGDTWERIARENRDVAKPSTLAVINGRSPGEQPRAGERVKIVVAG